MIRVYIESRDFGNGLDFAIVDQNEFDRKRYILRFGKYNIIREEIKEGELIDEPTFHLPQDAAMQFLKAMAEKAADYGVKLESDLKREGKLEAVERHLEDMRRLVFSIPTKSEK